VQIEIWRNFAQKKTKGLLMVSHCRKIVVFVECSKCFCERISSERERESRCVCVEVFFVKETYVVVVVVVGLELLKEEEEGDRYLVNGDRDSVLVFRGFLWTTQCAGDSSASHIGSHAEPAFLYSAPLVLGFPLAAGVEEG